MRMRSLVKQTGLLFVAIGAAYLSTQPLCGEQCSSATTVGRWAVVCEGYLTLNPSAPLTPAKELATVEANSNGVYTGSGLLSVGGEILHQVVQGQEQLNSNCTGEITYHQTINGLQAPDFHDIFVVTENGSKIHGLATDAGSVFACTLTRITTPEEGRK